MIKVCVDGTKILIVPTPPCLPFKLTDTVKGGAQSHLKAESKLVLLEKDFEEWTKNYKSDYISPPFVIPGKLEGNKIILAGVSTLTKVKNKPVVIQATIGTLMLKVASPAKIPPMPPPKPDPTPDPVPMYVMQVLITDTIQGTLKSL